MKENTFINYGNPPGLGFWILFCVVLSSILSVVTIGFRMLGGIGMTESEIIRSILINIVSTVITSSVISVCVYFAFFRKIPTEVEKRLNKMLNERLAADASWHDTISRSVDTNVMQALNPNNHELSSDHREIKSSLEFLKTEAHLAKERRNVSGGEIDVGKIISVYEKLSEDKLSLSNRLAEMSGKYEELSKRYELMEFERNRLLDSAKAWRQEVPDENLQREWENER